jgi:hypothetical protein
MTDWGVVIPGPYTKQWREHWLRRVLEAQQSIRREGPDEFRRINLITPEELREIRRVWLYENCRRRRASSPRRAVGTGTHERNASSGCPR